MVQKEGQKRFGTKGFTLAELLIVVAIIAVLVAVSIPIFASQLEKSRESTDMANMRAAEAAFLDAITTADTKEDTDRYIVHRTYGDHFYYEAYYDAASGTLIANPVNIVPYGKGTSTVGSETNTGLILGYDASRDYTGCIIILNYDETGAAIGWTSTDSWTKPGGYDGQAYIESPTTDLSDDLKYKAINGYLYHYRDGTACLDLRGSGSLSPIAEQTIYRSNGDYVFYKDSTWYRWVEGTDGAKGEWKKDDYYTENYGKIR